MNIENKKTPVKLILSSITLLFISYFIKEPRDESLFIYYQKNNIPISASEYCVYIFGLPLALDVLVIICFLLVALGVYLFIYKTDEEIGQVFKKVNFKYKTNVKVNPDSEAHSLKDNSSPLSKNLKEYRKITIIKAVCLISGIILLIIQIILLNKNQESLTLKSKDYADYAILNLVMTYGSRIYGAFLAYEISKYNRGNKYVWFICGFILPSITLIVAGFKRTLQYEYKYLLEYIDENKKANN